MNWRPALPELIIAAITVAAAALAAAAVAGWPGVVVVAAATTVIALLLLRGVVPRSAAQTAAPASRTSSGRGAISGYAQRRFIVATSLTSRPMYESDLRPVLEHILAARLAENHAVNLYTEPDAARKAFCRTRARRAPVALDRPSAGPRRRRARESDSTAFPAGPSPG